MIVQTPVSVTNENPNNSDFNNIAINNNNNHIIQSLNVENYQTNLNVDINNNNNNNTENTMGGFTDSDISYQQQQQHEYSMIQTNQLFQVCN